MSHISIKINYLYHLYLAGRCDCGHAWLSHIDWDQDNMDLIDCTAPDCTCGGFSPKGYLAECVAKSRKPKSS